MANTNTKIEWTDATWSPVSGCSKVSPGCAHCYAERVSHRFGFTSQPWTPEHAAENVVLHPDRLDQPLRWRKPRRIFVNSMSDLFHDAVPDEFIDRVFATMAICGAQRHTCRAGERCTHDEEPGCWQNGGGKENPKHTFQILTKRPDRMRAYLTSADRWSRIQEVGNDPEWSVGWDDPYELIQSMGWPLPNVWLGVSAENQHFADERIPLLLETPAAVRFVSAEPLLGPVNLTNITADTEGGPEQWNVLDKAEAAEALVPYAPNTSVDWVICGGESGPNARPMQLDWARSLRDQCQEAGVPYFLKQMGGARPGGKAELDGVEWKQFPEVSR